MKTATQITITLDGQQHVLPTLEHAVGLLQSSLTFELSSAAAHLASQLRLGGVLWQVRQAAEAMLGDRAGRDEWKRLIVMAGIDEKRAQRCMRVSAAIAQGGVVQPAMVARLQERARAIGCTQAFTARMPRTFDEATKLVSIAAPGPLAQTVSKLGTTVDPSSGNGKAGASARHGESGESGVPDACDDPRLNGEAAVARAMGMTIDEYRQYLAELDAEEAAAGDPAPVDAAPSAPRHLGTSAPLQLALADVYEHAARVRSEFERRVEAVKAGRCGAGELERVMRAFEAGLAALPV